MTISDYVADRRASTPSNAAEIAVPDKNEMLDVLRGYDIRSAQAMTKLLDRLKERLSSLESKRVLSDPSVYIDNRRIELDHGRDRLISAQERALSAKRQRYVRLAASLDAMSPLRVLSRGYAIAAKTNGEPVRSVKGLEAGEHLSLRLADGSADCLVQSVTDKL